MQSEAERGNERHKPQSEAKMHQVRRTGAERCRVRTEAVRVAAREGGVDSLREEASSDVQRKGAQGEGAERSSERQSQAAGARSADILAQTVSKRGFISAQQ